MQNVLAHRDGVGALALGDGNRNRRVEAPAIGKAHVLRWLLAAIGDLSHVVHEDWLVVDDAGDHVANILGGAQELASLKEVLLVAAGKFTRPRPAVGKT